MNMARCKPFLVGLERLTYVAVMLLAFVGCGGSGEPRYPFTHLEGTITLDGEPLDDGWITLVSDSADTGPATGAAIVQGRYSIPHAPRGKARAMLTCMRDTGKTVTVMDMPVPERIETIPPAYRTGITLEIQGERMQHDFELKSRQ